jgi:hypothetical protein
MYRVVVVNTRPGLKVDVSYLKPHRNILTAEREAKSVSRQPLLREARVMVEEFRQNGIEGSQGWLSDPEYLPVRTSQWQSGRPVFALHTNA